MVTRLPAVAVAVLLLPGCGAGVETTPDDDPFELLSYNPEVSAAITPDGDGGKQEDPPGKLAGMSAELIAILAVGVGAAGRAGADPAVDQRDPVSACPASDPHRDEA